MELDELKQVLYQQSTEMVSSNKPIILRAKKKWKPLSPIISLKRNLKREFFVGLGFSFFPIFIFIRYNGAYISWFALISLLIIADFSVRNQRILKSIVRFERRSYAVVQH